MSNENITDLFKRLFPIFTESCDNAVDIAFIERGFVLCEDPTRGDSVFYLDKNRLHLSLIAFIRDVATFPEYVVGYDTAVGKVGDSIYDQVTAVRDMLIALASSDGRSLDIMDRLLARDLSQYLRIDSINGMVKSDFFVHQHDSTDGTESIPEPTSSKKVRTVRLTGLDGEDCNGCLLSNILFGGSLEYFDIAISGGHVQTVNYCSRPQDLVAFRLEGTTLHVNVYGLVAIFNLATGWEMLLPFGSTAASVLRQLRNRLVINNPQSSDIGDNLDRHLLGALMRVVDSSQSAVGDIEEDVKSAKWEEVMTTGAKVLDPEIMKKLDGVVLAGGSKSTGILLDDVSGMLGLFPDFVDSLAAMLSCMESDSRVTLDYSSFTRIGGTGIVKCTNRDNGNTTIDISGISQILVNVFPFMTDAYGSHPVGLELHILMAKIIGHIRTSIADPDVPLSYLRHLSVDGHTRNDVIDKLKSIESDLITELLYNGGEEGEENSNRFFRANAMVHAMRNTKNSTRHLY